MPFSIIALPSGVTRIALEGDLDLFSAHGLRPELLTVVRRRPAAVEVDLTRLRSINTRGMQILLAFLADLAEIECRIVVTEGQDRALRARSPGLVDVLLDASRTVN